MPDTPMYVSTRSRQGPEVSLSRALLSGTAPDGGLYIPTFVPPLPPHWRDADDLPELAATALAGWVGDDFSADALRELTRGAVDFGAPLVQLGDDVWVLELFHGPTGSFKDYGARVMARLLDAYLRARGGSATMLVATSGDTGSAVADGFSGLDQVRVALLYPQGRVSRFQERQLTLKRPGVQAIRVAGDFDDCQRLVKEAFSDDRLEALRLASANSINVGRLIPQTLYYLWAACSQRGHPSAADAKDLTFVVPSGNLGNLTAGLMARSMAGHDWRFVAAHNANDYFPAFVAGSAEPFEFRPTAATISNAMDVGAPSNFERLCAMYEERLSSTVWATSVDDETTRRRMREARERLGYVACPHTAVGLEAAARHQRAFTTKAPYVVLATAHPAKFAEVVREALGSDTPREPRFDTLWQQETEVVEIAPTLDELRGALARRWED